MAAFIFRIKSAFYGINYPSLLKILQVFYGQPFSIKFLGTDVQVQKTKKYREWE